jgi:hypothetical protein
MELKKRRKYNRFESSLFIQFKPLQDAASYFLGLTRNLSYEGFSFAFQNTALEPGQRLQFKLKHPQSNMMISFLGDIIWQEQKNVNYLAGVRFCDFNKQNKEIMLKIISDSCSIPLPSLSKSNDTGTLVSNELISRIQNRYRSRSRYSWLYKSTVILITAAGISLLPAVIDNFDDAPYRPVANISKSMEIPVPEKMTDEFNNTQLHSSDIQDVIHPGQSRTVDKSNLLQVLKENIHSQHEENNSAVKLPVEINDLKEKNKFYIQVASFKDSDIAQGMLSELKKEYPAAYLFTQNDFYKLRIPDIKTYEQGNRVIKDIKMKFEITSILVERAQ